MSCETFVISFVFNLSDFMPSCIAFSKPLEISFIYFIISWNSGVKSYVDNFEVLSPSYIFFKWFSIFL